jgi:non-ribosomal peptide synthase protein (TIGR01720 family)
LSFEIVDLKGSDNEKDELARRVDAIHRSVHALSVPLMRTALFHLSDGDRLLIVIHHLVKDGVSWRILLEDLAAGYEFVRQGRPVRFPLKTDSYQRWAEALVRHSQHPALLEERDYWRNIADREAPGLPRDYDCSAGSRAANAVEHFELDVEETAALLTSVPGEFAVDINTLLLACFARALSVWSNNAWHPVWLEGHGREDIVPLNIGRTVGWFTTMFPVILEGHAGHSMEEHLRLTAQALAAIPNRGIGYGILRYLTPRELLADFPFRLQPRILFNYLGQLELPERTFRFASESPGRQVSDEMPWLVDLSLSGLVSGGKLAIGIEYSQQMYRPATVARLTSLYRENLLALLARSQQHAR